MFFFLGAVKHIMATVFAPAIEGLKLVKSENGEMLSKPFLDACKLILPVIGLLMQFFVLLLILI